MSSGSFGRGVGARRVLTVGELTQHIKSVLERDDLLSGLRVRGEISNFRHHSSGHMYFTLKDEAAQIRVVMFRGQNHRLRFKPHDGLAVDVEGYVSLYDRDGQYQLYAQEMHPAGLGDLHLAFEQLKRQLGEEGLFRDEIKRPLPVLPDRVAVITSSTGAALRDVLNVATRRCPGLHVVVLPVQVQGAEAPPQIVRALALAGTLPGVDVVILTRGGGSIEELWSFNEEVVARAIRACPRPVVVGVGHETDVTIADLVADMRAPTPSAAAELVFPACSALLGEVSGLVYRLRAGLEKRSHSLRQRLERLSASPVLRRPEQLVAPRAQRLDALTQRAGRAIAFRSERKRLELAQLAGKLDAMSPLAVLSRGYAICVADGGRGAVVSSARQVSPGEEVEVRLRSGSLACRVERAVPDGQPNGEE